jgi:hypothetical protein
VLTFGIASPKASEGLNLFHQAECCLVKKCPITAKQAKDKGVTKDKLIGMEVIDGKGCVMGTVKDISFTVGKQSINLTVKDDKG